MAPTPMDFFDLANLLDNDGNLQNEMMVKIEHIIPVLGGIFISVFTYLCEAFIYFF